MERYIEFFKNAVGESAAMEIGIILLGIVVLALGYLKAGVVVMTFGGFMLSVTLVMSALFAASDYFEAAPQSQIETHKQQHKEEEQEWHW